MPEPGHDHDDRTGAAPSAYADAAHAVAAQPSAAVLVWDGRGERLLWASDAARDLGEALTDRDGRADPRSPLSERLRTLGAGGLAPARGQRLERLRFSPSRLAPPTTCACRRVLLASGEAVLVTAVIGALPKLPPRGKPASPDVTSGVARDRETGDDVPGAEPPDTAPDPEASPVGPDSASTSASPERPRDRGTVRFLWQADARGRFTSVSGGLGGVIGAASADVIGRTWGDLVGEGRLHDPAGAIAGLFARRETWSGRTVHWWIEGTDRAVAVDLAGMPVFDRHRVLTGFRGFGLCRTDTVSPYPRPAPPAEASRRPAEAPVGPFAARPAAAPAFFDEGAAASGPTPATVPDDVASADEHVEGVPESGVGPLPDAAPARFQQAVAPVSAGPDASGPPVAPLAFEPLRVQVAGRLGDAPPPLRTVATAGVVPAPEVVARGEATPPVPSAKPARIPEAPAPAPRLSSAERSAFREIARALGARFDDEDTTPPGDAPEAPAAAARRTAAADVVPLRAPPPPIPAPESAAAKRPDLDILDRLPVGVLIHRAETVLFANRSLLDTLGYDDAEHLARDGGLARLFRGPHPTAVRAAEGAPPLALATRRGESIAAEIRLTAATWSDGALAGVMTIRKLPEGGDADARLKALELDLRAREAKVHELASILDTATDGAVVLDEEGRILSLNRAAEALFGYDQREVAGETFAVLLAPESHGPARDYLEGLRADGVASLLNDGREVLGRVRQGGTIPLFMTIGLVGEGEPGAAVRDRKFCAVLRDVTAVKKAEGELHAAKRAGEAASVQKADFLAKVSHEVRTPLNAIIGFAEVMLEERFGPVGNERYRDYLRDIHASGQHVVGMVNDLLDLAKIEAGRMDLAFGRVKLNELVSGSVALLQPQAVRERIVVRTSFAPRLPPVIADERSIRQIVLNLVSNAIKFTDAGGQVIVSTALTDRGEVAVRVRDTGIGMSHEEVEAALEPFRQLSASRRGGGTGLGLPLTKALVEANRGALQITSAREEGTLVEVLFPSTRVLAE